MNRRCILKWLLAERKCPLGDTISKLSGKLFRIAYPEGTKLPKGELKIEPYSKDDFYNKVITLSEGFSLGWKA
jgi:hypothetical protein